MGFAGAIVHTGSMMRLIFCDSNIINHYLCDIFPLLQLSCSSTYANEIVVSAVVGTVIIVSSLIIFISYALIFLNILHIPSSKGWSKALSTCGSHITTVSLFYGFGLLTHVKLPSSRFVEQGKFFTVFSTNVVPMLNPLIYSLRNKDVKIAVKKTLKRITKWMKPVMPPFLYFFNLFFCSTVSSSSYCFVMLFICLSNVLLTGFHF